MYTDIIKKLSDKKLATEIKYAIKNGKLTCWLKRSTFKILIPLNVTPEISYLTGVIYGDGNVSIAQRKEIEFPRLRISLYNASIKYLRKINNMLYSIFRTHGKLTKKKDKNCYILSINNKLVCLYFLKIIGVKAGKKNNLKVPNILKNKKLFRFFLAGLFDTDGFLTETFGIMMCGSNSKFLKEVIKLSKNYYDIEFRKFYSGIINANNILRTRCQIQLSRVSIPKFISLIPLKHEKYNYMFMGL